MLRHGEGIVQGTVVVETIAKDQRENDINKRLQVEKGCSLVNEVIHKILSPLKRSSAVTVHSIGIKSDSAFESSVNHSAGATWIMHKSSGP
jgi:hypothetical protein